MALAMTLCVCNVRLAR